jgi:8-oxo-dGTP diphosphatase
MTEFVWAILQHNNKFLLVQKAPHYTHGGTWAFPGGKIDPTDRTPEMAVNRGLQEEAGLTGKRFRKLNDMVCSDSLGEYHIQSFICDRWHGEPRPSCYDIVGVRWFLWEEMYSIDLKLSPIVDDSLMYISYLMQNYDCFPKQWTETWREVDGSG